MAKKKAAPKVSKKAAAKKTTTKKSVAKKAAAKTTATKSPAKKAPVKKVAAKKKAAVKKAAVKAKPVRKKGVRRATLVAGVRKKNERTLGRSRIPVDAPLAMVFQSDAEAQKAFAFLEIQTIRELEEFDPDELVRRLSSPAKQTVGRIRKMLALNNRCLQTDESFAIEFQERITQNQMNIR